MTGRASELLARTGLAAACVLPPAAAGVGLWSWLTRHPVTTLVLFLIYETLVLAMGFAGKVFGNLQNRWADRATDAIDRRMRWRISRFERAYRDDLISRHRFVDLKGLATRGDYAPGLAEVFVDVSLIPRPAHETSADPLAGTPPSAAPGATGPMPSRQSLPDFLGSERGTALAVIGAPGTGKTTLLKHLALRPPYGHYGGGRAASAALPVLLFLRDHAAAIAERPGITLAEIIRASLRRLVAEEPEGWFEQQLMAGRCVILLDGLDEVAREEDRRAVSKWAEEQIEQYEANDYVLTSRPQGYLSAPLNRAQVLQVRRFTGEQISSFVHGWYHAIEKLSTGVDDAGVAERAADEAADLLQRLRARPVLYDLAANPLLLTMIANVHRYRGALPGSRADLYREICEVLLWRRHQAKNPAEGQVDIDGAKKETVLRELAYRMMTEQLRDVSAERAATILRPALYRVGLNTPADATAVFLDAVTSNGMLVERERGLYAFAHLTLQEHLAALHIRHQGLTEVLTAAVDDDWWRETTLLHAARVDPAPVIAACLTTRTPRALALAFDCAEAATEVDPAAVRELEALREDALTEPVGSPTRRLMTAVTVTRLLRETVQLNDSTVVCSRPVTNELWQLFAAERPGADPLATGAGDPAGTAVGMSRTQALAFVGWVNGLLPEGPWWTLPTRTDVDDPAFRLVAPGPGHSIWCSGVEELLVWGTRVPGDGDHLTLPELWVPDGYPHPWAVQACRVASDPVLSAAFRDAQLTLLHLAYDAVNHRLANTLAEAVMGAGSREAVRHYDAALIHDIVRILASAPHAADQTAVPSAANGPPDDLAHVLVFGPEHFAADREHRDPIRLDLAIDPQRTLAHLHSAVARMQAAHALLGRDGHPDREGLSSILEDALDQAHEVAARQRATPARGSADSVLLWSCAALRLHQTRGDREFLAEEGDFARDIEGVLVHVPLLEQVVHPDELATTATVAFEEGRVALLPAFPPAGLATAVDRLLEETSELFEAVQTTYGNLPLWEATALETASQVLATVFDKRQQASRAFADLAMGCNVLRRRADDTITPSEAIVLARA